MLLTGKSSPALSSPLLPVILDMRSRQRNRRWSPGSSVGDRVVADSVSCEMRELDLWSTSCSTGQRHLLHHTAEGSLSGGC